MGAKDLGLNSERFAASDFKFGVLVAPIALSVSWLIIKRDFISTEVAQLFLYSLVMILCQVFSAPFQKRILIMSLSKEGSRAFVAFVVGLIATTLGFAMASPPLRPFTQIVALVVCGACCYAVLPFSRALIQTTGSVIGSIASLLAILVATPLFLGVTILLIGRGKNLTLAVSRASSTLGREAPEIHLLVLFLSPVIASLIGVMLFAISPRPGSNQST